jgi:hypothetical protein
MTVHTRLVASTCIDTTEPDLVRIDRPARTSDVINRPTKHVCKSFAQGNLCAEPRNRDTLDIGMQQRHRPCVGRKSLSAQRLIRSRVYINLITPKALVVPNNVLAPKAIVVPSALMSRNPCGDLRVQHGLNRTATSSMNIPIASLAVHGKLKTPELRP